MTDITFSMQNVQDALSRRKTQNEREHKERIRKIYEEIPRIQEIDREISSSYSAFAKRLITNPDSPSRVLEQKEKTHALIQEKRSLLSQHGYSENYLDSIYTCPICKDEGHVDGKICSCVMQLKIAEFYRCSNLGPILNRENFDTFRLDYYSKEILPGHDYSPYENMKEKLEQAKAFVENFDEEGGNILLYGEAGLGKTFLSNCIAKALLDSCHSVLYVSSNRLFEDILSKSMFSNAASPEISSMKNFVYSADLLVIDDLGTELTNNFVVSQLFEIINQRQLTGKSTIISTNLSLKQISSLYSERILSRMIEHYALFHLIGKNIRYQKNLD